jgi:hypothetical protein
MAGPRRGMARVRMTLREDPSSMQIVQLVCKMEPAFGPGKQVPFVGGRVRTTVQFDRSVFP